MKKINREEFWEQAKVEQKEVSLSSVQRFDAVHQRIKCLFCSEGGGDEEGG